MKNFRRTIETKMITENLKHTVMVSINEEFVFFRVDYKEPRFVIERSFDNDRLGLRSLDKTIESLNSDEKVKSYLRLEDDNAK
jgi:hypothetical protein